jgi:DEAD/DEAH box helicase domain-containing protein
MIPSLLARHLETGLGDYLRTTFPIGTPAFRRLLDDFITNDGELFRGPYVSVQLPFQQSHTKEGFFEGVALDNLPYVHQEKSFARLTGPSPRPTLVATGTGSGKTESFLLPILEHCWRERGKPGIKAIIIYPMNALATDQSKRLASLIHKSTELRGQVTAGLFVGESEKHPRKTMEPDGILTDKDLMRSSPPDILLTNYKMLDMLLNRPKDQGLWRQNEPETLRFLVVDELHTFDGAQGTDLACLIRRLKARLQAPTGHLVGIGTSATLGGANGTRDLLDYASQVFGEIFDEDAIIGETRLSAIDFLKDHPALTDRLPPIEALEALAADPAQEDEALGQALANLWFEHPPTGDGWRIQLSDALKNHALFQALLKVLQGQAMSYWSLLPALEAVAPAWGEVPAPDQALRLDSLLALVALARVRVGGRLRPFVNLRVQLWLRELRRMVASVEKKPKLRFSSDLNTEQLKRHLPVIHCRECGATGWAGVKRSRSPKVEPALKAFYQAYFGHDPDTAFLFPDDREQVDNVKSGVLTCLCGDCLTVQTKRDATECTSCGYEHLERVFLPYTVHERERGLVGHHDCPYCEGSDSLTILGLQAASVTSVMISQLFAARLNDDKKLLTFSDSVQDASHRAGFFSARTHTFGLRAAIAQSLREVGPQTLESFPTAFADYWRSRWTDEEYVSHLIPADMCWLRDFETMCATEALPANSRLIDLINQRLTWELASEFGWRARIGRTLEKSALAIARMRPAAVEAASTELTRRLSGEFQALQTLGEAEVRPFVLGLLRQLRVMGAIALPMLDTYVREGGNAYLLSRPTYMPALGPTKRPHFVASTKYKRIEPAVRGAGDRATWFQTWAIKCWDAPDRLLLRASIMDVLPTVFKVLARHGLLKTYELDRAHVWGLEPSALELVQDVTMLRCDACGQSVSTATDEAPHWHEAPCVRAGCRGRYQPEAPREDYYARLYRDGDLERIFAQEHTGLLDRETRETVERTFIRRLPERKPWDPNLLSCTPTLEMGIDIGDLSSVVLCSVPPAQANYLQRVGRAGRQDGNALTLTVVNARPHDLFFFAEPEEMIQGNVATPGVFLDAAAVLERQLTAYCLDRWVATGLPNNAIPSDLRKVLPAIKTARADQFPFNFLAYISQHQAELLDSFLNLFQPKLSPESTRQLTNYMTGDETLGGALRFKLMNAFIAVQKQVEGLQKSIRRLGDLLRKHDATLAKALDHDQHKFELLSEKEALQELVRSLLERPLYQFLSDEGLLPNYAFPEAGVALQSIIYRKKEGIQNGEGPAYDKTVFAYERPARVALGELAPTSHFYAEGRKVMIDQVDLALSEIETWRFCPSCSFMQQLAGVEEQSCCPRCGTAMWADAGQKREMLRMRQVYATTEDRKSRAGDDSDDRETAFFDRHLLVSAHPNDVLAAFKVKQPSFPFGMEFLAKAAFREVNFGEGDSQTSEWHMAGHELRNKGFMICRHCGKVQIGGANSELRHTFGCTARDKDAKDNLLQVVYLYREFSSEALRLLLPVASLAGSDAKVKSLMAALHLGLRRFFHGNIDHLNVTLMDEPVPDTELRKKYMVLYDVVPGGTGYLKQLAKAPEALNRVFRLAFEHIRACSCQQDPDKDGCYRCVYAYRNSRDMESISRRTALELLAEILCHEADWEPIDTLQAISVNALVDSELEARLIESLRQAAGPTWRQDVINGKPGYHFSLGDRAYQLEQQVPIGPAQGVAEPMLADFVLTPLQSTEGQRPLVLFTDGYTFHQERLATDLAQRMALMRSGRFWVWSLSYRDVVKPTTDHFENYLQPGRYPSGARFNAMIDGYGKGNALAEFRNVHQQDSLTMLMRFLKDPDVEHWRLHAFVLAVLTIAQPPLQADAWLAGLQGQLEDGLAHSWSAQPAVYGRADWNWLRLLVRVPPVVMMPPDASALVAIAQATAPATPETQQEWNGMLRLMNAMQFLPRFEAIAPGQTLFERKIAPEQQQAPAWQEALDLAEATWHPLLERMLAAGFPPPEPGYELAAPGGKVLGSAELAWPAIQVAALAPHELDFETAFTGQGWQCWPLETLAAEAAKFEEMTQHVCQYA